MFANRFNAFAWFVVAFTIGVIVWGAVVRATGSGAGCGSHWPTCNGEILPALEEMETFIEFSHRVTSAMAGFLSLILFFWAVRSPQTRLTRIMAGLSLLFMIIEGGIGMLLVRLELVGNNDSTERAVMIALHLVNTLILLGFLTMTAWSSGVKRELRFNFRTPTAGLLVVGLVGGLLISAAGAVTALGDTLFPVEALRDGTLDATGHFLVELRILHPIIAVVVSAYLFALSAWMLNRGQHQVVRRRIYMLLALIVIQTFVGVVNIALLAPLVMQMLHLFLADLFWIVLLLLTVETTTRSPVTAQASEQARIPSPSAAAGD